MNNVVNLKVKRLKCLAPKLIYRFEQRKDSGIITNLYTKDEIATVISNIVRIIGVSDQNV